LTWQNPYTPIVAGADRGQLARPPDNQAHQVVISGGMQPDKRMQFSGSLALGRMAQDEDLLPATVNPTLATPLPRTSADAEVDTLTATVRGFYAATERLRLNAELRYNDRDNRTPQDSFIRVTTDVTVSTPRVNLPYDYTDTLYRIGGDYRMDRISTLSLGLDHRRRRRDLQEIDHTVENELAARLRSRPRRGVEITGKLALARRDGSDFEPAATTQPPENPLHRAFNLADRERTSAGLRVSVMPREGATLGANVDYADNDYFNSDIGLKAAKQLDLTVDAAASPREDLVLNGYVGRSLIRHEQAGSQAFAGPDWTARNRDKTDSLGFGAERRALWPGIDVRGQYAYSRSNGRVAVNGGGTPAFPELAAKLHSLGLYGTWHWRPDTDFKLGYRYERYRDADWQVDDVAPATVPNVLSLGQGSPDYRINLLTLSAEYRF
jgi:MtrB/PioB family decaheme-associated outer membrane protein